MTLSEARLKLNLTQIALSVMTGLTVQTLSKIEHAKCFPNHYTRKKIEDAIGGVEIDWLQTAIRHPYKPERLRKDSPEDRLIAELYRFFKARQNDRETAFLFIYEFLDKLKIFLNDEKQRTARKTVTGSGRTRTKW